MVLPEELRSSRSVAFFNKSTAYVFWTSVHVHLIFPTMQLGSLLFRIFLSTVCFHVSSQYIIFVSLYSGLSTNHARVVFSSSANIIKVFKRLKTHQTCFTCQLWLNLHLMSYTVVLIISSSRGPLDIHAFKLEGFIVPVCKMKASWSNFLNPRGSLPFWIWC